MTKPTLAALRPPRYAPVRLCSGKGGYEAVPEAPVRIDLRRARQALEATGVEVVDARVLLIAAIDPEVTLSEDGRVLVKTRDPEAASRALAELWARIERGRPRPG